MKIELHLSHEYTAFAELDVYPAPELVVYGGDIYKREPDGVYYRVPVIEDAKIVRRDPVLIARPSKELQ